MSNMLTKTGILILFQSLPGCNSELMALAIVIVLIGSFIEEVHLRKFRYLITESSPRKSITVVVYRYTVLDAILIVVIRLSPLIIKNGSFSRLHARPLESSNKA